MMLTAILILITQFFMCLTNYLTNYKGKIKMGNKIKHCNIIDSEFVAQEKEFLYYNIIVPVKIDHRYHQVRDAIDTLETWIDSTQHFDVERPNDKEDK